MNDSAQFIGTGWAFPPSFDKVTGATVMTNGEEDIRGSLHVLLSTTLGERLMHEDYGCNLQDYVFDPLNSSNEAYIKKLVETAILYYEPRITLLDLTLDVNDGEGRMDITITFTIDATNSRSNYVYPYYLTERTNP